MACPKWCKSPSQPIDVLDVLEIIDDSLGNEKTYNQSIEIGSEEVITYMDMLKITSRIMNKKRWIFSIPFFTLGFSKLWVALFSDSSQTFVGPLIESLRHDMTLSKQQFPFTKPSYLPIRQSIKNALEGTVPYIPRRVGKPEEKNTVRSVQRLPNPNHKTAIWVAESYPKWLSRTFRYLLKASQKEDITSFRLFGITLLKLQFVADRSDEQRQLFYIVGGFLAKRTDYGWLEFRSVLNNSYVVSAIHEFVPRLPWTIYKSTQAVVHLFVMKKFGNFIAKSE
jgi:hypothetical protein